MLEAMDYKAAAFWLSALQMLGLIALFVYTHLTNKSKANESAISGLRADIHEHIDGLEARMTMCESRGAVMERRLEDAPKHSDLSRIYDRLNVVAEDLSKSSGQMRQLSTQLSMINQYLLTEKGPKQ